MSTKSSIAWGDDFHLYTDLMDDHSVYLEMDGTGHEFSYNHGTLRIPVHIWEVIRQRSGVDLSLADKSDDDLNAMVEERVAERIEQARDLEGDGKPSFFRFAGIIPYGDVDDGPDEQIARGMEYYRTRRREQQEIRQAIEDVERGMKRR